MVRKVLLKYSDNFISQAEDIILQCFFPEGEEMTISQIKERAGYSYERINTSLKKLEEKKIVYSKSVGKTLLYKADYNNLYLKRAFHYYMTDRLLNFANKHQIIYKALKNSSKNIFGIMLLFGSYSKENETKNSDLDIMIVSDYEEEYAEINKIKSRYGLNISIAKIEKNEFPKIKSENPELWKDLKEYAIVFNGEDLFYHNFY